ncbi:hypothetical protein Anas_06234 [Armadillidium nasatum]|uniref:Ig-like domain-containing protein n=1 Tax=Armadillidium nasatum TaxID=96803 RepID=A0A5N5SVN1_9CRUS|nr:hypothetical protein Anas_06234 [Armadillidium nasatum]
MELQVRLTYLIFIVTANIVIPNIVQATTVLPPRLSTSQSTIHVKEGQNKVVLECDLDVGDDPVAFKWLKCEATNDAGVDAKRIEVIVDPADYNHRFREHEELPDTSEVLSELAASLNDVLAEGECSCDVMFLLHASPDSPPETLVAQANFVNIVASPIVSDAIRVSAVLYSDYVNSKLSFAKGTNQFCQSLALLELKAPMILFQIT